MTDQSEQVGLYQISQATRATFTDLYLRLTFLFFIQAGSKRVVTAQQEVVGEEGDLLIFPPDAVVTMENRPVMDHSYRAVGVSFPDTLVRSVFGDRPAAPASVQVVRAAAGQPATLLPLIEDTLARADLPDPIRAHRLVEPLIWLRDRGVTLPIPGEEAPLARVRRLIETDLERPWRAGDVAAHLAMSEPTMRRVLARTGQSFSKILLFARLEHGLSLLQTTEVQISEIAMICGFKTPSHFSDAFRKRFGIRPKQIRSAEI